MNINPILMLLLSVADNKNDEVIKYPPIGNPIAFDARALSQFTPPPPPPPPPPPFQNQQSPDAQGLPSVVNSASLNLFLLHDQLYYNVISGDYDNAALLSIVLEQNNNGQTVANVVNRLLNNGTENILEYAYKLWHYGGKGIVVSYFPKQFKHLVNGDLVKFQNQRDGLPVKLDANVDGDGDRPAWGDGSDKSIHRLSWKSIPIWEGNKLYFKFLNMHRNQYLKVEVAKDNVGDRKAFGSDVADTDRHQWYLRPVIYNDKVLFYIYNRKYNQPLILGRWLDEYQDRILWGSHDNAIGNPEHFGWHIDLIEL